MRPRACSVPFHSALLWPNSWPRISLRRRGRYRPRCWHRITAPIPCANYATLYRTRTPPYGQPPPDRQPPPHGPPQYARPPQYGPPGQYGQQQYAPGGYGQGQQWTATPPYGQAAADDAEPAAERRGNRRRWIALIAVAVVVVAAGVTALLLLIQGGGDRVLSSSAVERDVAQQFQEKQGVSVKLTCKERMTLVTGGTYHCTGVTGEGESETVTIRVTDAKAAAYTWSDR